MHNEEGVRGIGDVPRSEWPALSTGVELGASPIQLLKPESKLHERVKDYLLKRLETSERQMRNFYSRWQVAERKIQAFICLPEWEEQLRTLNKKGEPPKITRIVVPYSFATVSTLVTFHMHAFTGRRPIFQVGSWKDETISNAQMMEIKIQFDAEHTKLVKFFHNFLQDMQIYGVGILRNLWEVRREFRTVRRQRNFHTLGDMSIISKMVPQREKHVVYEGNMVASQDPFMFFPDPRVPMAEVNRRGEFVFWRTMEGRHILLRDEDFMWVEDASASLPANRHFDTSSRSLLSEGDAHPGLTNLYGTQLLRDYMEVDQGTIDLIPRELGIGESEEVEKWIFTILNKDQIIQAEPFDTDHGLHPVAVAEPYGLGYGFGEAGLIDYLAPLQDAISWFFNCYSEDTEVLTEDGWVPFPQLTRQHRVATVDSKTRKLWYEFPSELFSYEYSGEMIEFDSKRYNALVTPNHRMWSRKRYKGTWEFKEAGSYQRTDEHQMLGWVESVEGGLSEIEIAGEKLEANLAICFLGFFVSEGSTSKGTSNRAHGLVRLNQLYGSDTHDFIKEVVDELPWNFKWKIGESPLGKPYSTWQVHNYELGEWLRTNCGGVSDSKRLPEIVFLLSPTQKKKLVECMVLGDGTIWREQLWRYNTTSKVLADQTQRLVLEAGGFASIAVDQLPSGKQLHRVNINWQQRDSALSGRFNVSSVEYRGKVYCFTNSTHLTVTRRCGRAIVCGQSHIDNVRKSLNDMFVVDPAMVEMQDLEDPEPGKMIRLKAAAMGRDVRSAIHQLEVRDVTSQHVADAQELFRLGQFLSGASDNILGLQDSGGRKTATEVRQSGEAAASRLASQTRIVSAQGVSDLARMMSLNNQQFLSEEFYMMVVGQEGARKPIRVTPDQLVGDFYYPINDGTLPLDRVAIMDVWREVFTAMLADQELRRAYSVPRVFEHIAELGGARNIESFRMDVLPDNVVGEGAANGTLVPTQQAVEQQRSGQTPGINGTPSDRVLSGLLGG